MKTKKMYKLLICDDENYILEALENNIKWKKYDVDVVKTAINGQIALNQFKIEHYDIVILDIKMPIMSGMEVAREIRKIDKKTQIIFLTSLSDFDYARKAITVGACAYILKPFVKDDIIAALKVAIENLSSGIAFVTEDEKRLEDNSSEGNSIVKRVNDYIENNIQKKLSIKVISDTLGYSTNYLGQLYKKHTGIFLNEYIVKVKMGKAVKLLEVHQNSVGDIAEALGYGDIAYFIKQFREFYGVTPKVYRDSNLK
ncbi:MAG: response regulator [Oscillospiraceae bacterium]